ncbi:MAG: hypothetical protein U9N35_04675 [Euryarchaeota archaeon]|nr:hypothetical protein [Euryarchaeota archaeon]
MVEKKKETEERRNPIVIDLEKKILIGEIDTIIDKEKVLQEDGISIEEMSSDEQVIFGIIQKKEEIYQSELPEITGYSRSKISRTIRDMVNKDIIEREEKGMSFLLRLKR